MSFVETHEPGAYTPRAGLYACDCAGGHLWRIDLAGHLFPPFPPGCSAKRWRAAEVGATSPAEGDASENTNNAKYEEKKPTSPHSGRACRP